jgi:hypothetical protein
MNAEDDEMVDEERISETERPGADVVGPVIEVVPKLPEQERFEPWDFRRRKVEVEMLQPLGFDAAAAVGACETFDAPMERRQNAIGHFGSLRIVVQDEMGPILEDRRHLRAAQMPSAHTSPRVNVTLVGNDAAVKCPRLTPAPRP